MYACMHVSNIMKEFCNDLIKANKNSPREKYVNKVNQADLTFYITLVEIHQSEFQKNSNCRLY